MEQNWSQNRIHHHQIHKPGYIAIKYISVLNPILRSFLLITYRFSKNASFAKIKEFDLPAGEPKWWAMKQNWFHFRNLRLKVI